VTNNTQAFLAIVEFSKAREQILEVQINGLGILAPHGWTILSNHGERVAR
jgi:hypothetical protein